MLRVRVATSGWLGGPGLNTFYFDGDDSEAHAGEVVTRVQAAFLEIKLAMSSDWTSQVSNIVDALNPVNGALTGSWTAEAQSPQVGGQGTGGICPPSTMFLLQLQTSTYSDGSRIQGRSFLGPASNVFRETNGTPHADGTAAILAGGAALMDTGMSPADLCVWRRERKAGGTTEKPITHRDGSAAIVTSVTSPDKFAVLRSRRD